MTAILSSEVTVSDSWSNKYAVAFQRPESGCKVRVKSDLKFDLKQSLTIDKRNRMTDRREGEAKRIKKRKESVRSFFLWISRNPKCSEYTTDSRHSLAASSVRTVLRSRVLFLKICAVTQYRHKLSYS